MSTKLDFRALRKDLGLSQDEMATRMGLSKRAYSRLETKPELILDRHIALANMASLEVALERDDPGLLTDEMAVKIGAIKVLLKRKSV
jgi:transcriptional regulator with XRE-family HTH domain